MEIGDNNRYLTETEFVRLVKLWKEEEVQKIFRTANSMVLRWHEYHSNGCGCKAKGLDFHAAVLDEEDWSRHAEMERVDRTTYRKIFQPEKDRRGL